MLILTRRPSETLRIGDDINNGVAEISYTLPKDGEAHRVDFEIRYRPDDTFEKDYVLHVIVPEPSDSDEPEVSGP
jgi:hypothetical protein